MLKIQKNGNVKVVTKGAYENLYKDMGYEIITDKKPQNFKDTSVLEEKHIDKIENKVEDKKENKADTEFKKSFINKDKK